MRYYANLLLGLFVLGCLRVPPTFEHDAGELPDAATRAPLSLESLTMLDRSGATWPVDSAPRRPVLKLRWSTEPESDPDTESPVWLLLGEPRDGLLEDLATPPLRAANRERIIPASLSRDGREWQIAADERIARDTPLSLVVGGWLRAADTGDRIGTPIVRSLRISADPSAGTEVLASWPPDGAAAVSANLIEIALRLDGPIAEALPGSVSLREGENVEDTTLSVVPCPDVGWTDGTCLRLVPTRPLRRGSEHRIVIDGRLLDPTGSPIGPWTARFTTALTPPPEPSPRALECALDEEPTTIGCALADEARIVLRVDVAEPARIHWSLGSNSVWEIAPRGDVSLIVGDLPADSTFTGTLRVEGTSGLVSEWTVALATTAPLASLSIVEVRADPLGPEPTQEYVEVLNYGPVSIDLEGFAIADRDDAVGDLLSGTLSAGERALIVSERFDPDEPSDPRVPPGVRLLRVDRSIGAGGLSNAGEPLFLRDSEGIRISSAPAMSSGGGGVCLVRSGPPGRSADGFVRSPCTPGTP